MSSYVVTDTELSSVADAIRSKGGTGAQLAFPGDFVTAIGALSGESSPWSEFTAASAATRADACMNILMPDRQAGKAHFAYLTGKAQANFCSDQLICVSAFGNASVGGGVRWRNSESSSVSALSSSTGLAIAVGDTYMICEDMT